MHYCMTKGELMDYWWRVYRWIGNI